MAKRPKGKNRTQKTEVLAWVICGTENLKQMTSRWRIELERVTGTAIRFAYDLAKGAVQVICADHAVHQRIGQILTAAGFACQEQRVYVRTHKVA